MAAIRWSGREGGHSGGSGRNWYRGWHSLLCRARVRLGSVREGTPGKQVSRDQFRCRLARIVALRLPVLGPRSRSNSGGVHWTPEIPVPGDFGEARTGDARTAKAVPFRVSRHRSVLMSRFLDKQRRVRLRNFGGVYRSDFETGREFVGLRKPDMRTMRALRTSTTSATGATDGQRRERLRRRSRPRRRTTSRCDAGDARRCRLLRR